MYGTDAWTSWCDRWQARLTRRPPSPGPVELMRKANPAIIPRNHRVEEALAAAVDEGDFSVMERFLAVLTTPFAYTPEQDEYAVSPRPSAQPYRTFCGT